MIIIEGCAMQVNEISESVLYFGYIYNENKNLFRAWPPT